jgi:hypothetical protein
MDDKLRAILDNLTGGKYKRLQPVEFRVRFTDNDGTVELIHGDRNEAYRLKPMTALFGEGHGASINTDDDRHLTLLATIEEEIVGYDEEREPLTDADVSLALRALSMNPDQPSCDPLARSIQTSLRLCLSLNDYSRQEVRQAIRKIEKSVNRHKDGLRGYIEFIQEYLFEQ